MPPTLSDPGLIDWLHAASAEALDGLAFGVIGMTPDGTVAIYNRTEAEMARLTPERVIGRHFFSAVAPCTNNYLIAHRFETEADLDVALDYVFTLRMKVSPVRLRLLKRPDIPLMYMAVERT